MSEKACNRCWSTKYTVRDIEFQRDSDNAMIMSTSWCSNCIDTFNRGRDSVGKHHIHVVQPPSKRSEMDEWQFYRNMLAKALAVAANTTQNACTSVANVVIDKKLLPRDGRKPEHFRDGIYLVIAFNTMLEASLSGVYTPEMFLDDLLHTDDVLLKALFGWKDV